MRPHFGGVYALKERPNSESVTAYQEGDILFSNIRPYFRKIWLATHSGGCSADVLCIRADKAQCLPRYLYYILTTDNFITDYLKGCKGAKMPRGEVNRMLNYDIPLPPLPEQKRIAGVLGAIDEKIEVNRAKINSLSLLAQSIYDYWFVQFDFPNENGKPYKSSNGKLAFNPTLKRYIPANWSVQPLSELADYLFGNPFDSSLFNSTGEGFPIVRIRNIKDGYTHDFTTEAADKHYIIKNGDFLIGMDGYFDMNYWIGGEAYLVQRTCRITAKDKLYQAWLSLSLYAPIKHLEKSLLGATLGHLGKAHLDQIYLPVPPKNEFKQILAYLNQLIERQVSLGEEVRSLEGMRDELLPLLMNGQLQILTLK